MVNNKLSLRECFESTIKEHLMEKCIGLDLDNKKDALGIEGLKIITEKTNRYFKFYKPYITLSLKELQGILTRDEMFVYNSLKIHRIPMETNDLKYNLLGVYVDISDLTIYDLNREECQTVKRDYIKKKFKFS